MASAKSGLNSPAISCGLKLNILFPANFCFVLWPCSFALSASTLFKVRIRSTETDVECWNEGINGHFSVWLWSAHTGLQGVLMDILVHRQALSQCSWPADQHSVQHSSQGPEHSQSYWLLTLRGADNCWPGFWASLPWKVSANGGLADVAWS